MTRRKKSNRTHDATERVRARRKSSTQPTPPRQTANRSRTNARQQDTRNRTLHALALMRRGESLSAASKAEHIKPATLLRYVGRAIRQDKPGGRFRVLKTDKFVRHLQHVQSTEGPIDVAAKGINAARDFAAHANAIAHFNRTGDASQLERFKGKTFTVGRKRYEFLTDPDTLMQLAEADALRLDSLYASVTSRS